MDAVFMLASEGVAGGNIIPPRMPGLGGARPRPNDEFPVGPGDARRHPEPQGDRARRRTGRRPTPALVRRRVTQTGGADAGPRTGRPDAPGHGPGPRHRSGSSGTAWSRRGQIAAIT